MLMREIRIQAKLRLRKTYLGLVIERAISEDLNKKMSSTWEDELKTRYKALLSQAVQRFHKENFNPQQPNNSTNAAVVVTATTTNDNSNSTNSNSNSGSSSSTSMSSQQTLLLQQHLNSADLASITKFRETNQISSLDHDIIVQDVLRQQSVLDAEDAVHAHDAAMSRQYALILKNELKRPRGVRNHCTYFCTQLLLIKLFVFNVRVTGQRVGKETPARLSSYPSH